MNNEFGELSKEREFVSGSDHIYCKNIKKLI